MLTLLKQLLYDEEKFTAAVGMLWLSLRGVLIALGLAVTGGQIDLGPTMWWLGPVIAGLAGTVGHGDKNLSVEEIEKRVTAELKRRGITPS